jgi:hypothetical protein
MRCSGYVYVLELVDRVEDYLGGWHPERGRRREMELFDAAVLHCEVPELVEVIIGR